MTKFVSWHTAHATRRAGEAVLGNVPLMRTDFFGPPKFFYSMSKEERMRLHEQLLGAPDAPHAYHIEVPPESETPAHFHRVPQYQVFVQGGGRLGRRHPIELVMVHYTDEFTGYGPIVASGDGLAYFTLRSFFDPGAEYVDRDGAREKLRPSARRYLVVGSDRTALSSPENLAARTDVTVDRLIEPHDDGVAAYVVRARPAGSITGPEPSQGGGQYWLALNGSIEVAGETYPCHSLGWVSRSDDAVTACAGRDGAEIGAFQFPRTFTSRSL